MKKEQPAMLLQAFHYKTRQYDPAFLGAGRLLLHIAPALTHCDQIA